MRNGFWILAACSTVGLAVTAVIAQDRLGLGDRYSSYGTTSAERSEQIQPQSGSASSPGATADRNPFAWTRESRTGLPEAPAGHRPQGGRPARRYRRSPGLGTPTTSRSTTERLGPRSTPTGSRYGRLTTDSATQPKDPLLQGWPPAESSPTEKDSGSQQTAPPVPETETVGRIANPSHPESETDSGPSQGLIQAEFERTGNRPERNYIRRVQGSRSFRNSDASTRDFQFQGPPQRRPQRNFSWPVQTTSAAIPSAEVAETPVTVSEKATPTGPFSAKFPKVVMEWVKKGRIHVGKECAFDLVVRNDGKVTAADVAVEAYFPTTVRLTKASPQPADKRDHLAWNFPSLNPGEEKIIEISLIPSKRGDMKTRSFVRYTAVTEGIFEVEEPMLQIAMKGPEQVLVGDPASQTILVSNPGTGIATNVAIEAVIPAGLEHPRGERLVMEIGALNPGESRSVRLALAAAAGGKHLIQINASADDNLQRAASSEVQVIAPSLEIEIDGPDLRYLGREATYTIEVANDGSATSNNVRVTQYLPDGFEFVSAENGGTFNKENRTITWFVGKLEEDQDIQLSCKLKPTKIGSYSQRVVATSEQGIKAEETYHTDVDGTASLVLEIVDLDDPVEIATETAYEVRVRNEGTKAGQNIVVNCDLPDGIELLTAQGPTGAAVRNGQIVFKSLPSLDPGKTAIYRVHVAGKVAGNHRFRAQMSSDSIQEPLTFEELTKFYSD